MFEVAESGIPGCVELISEVRADARGHFVKTVHAEFFREHGLRSEFAEQYYSVSRKGVLRGLHFQLPPHHHDKLVYCTGGAVLDVVVDLRKGSPSYGQHRTFELSAERANIVYVPAGLAHGFYVLSNEAQMVYNVTSVYAPEHDSGIRWDSAGIPWPDAKPIISERDGALPDFGEWESPFEGY